MEEPNFILVPGVDRVALLWEAFPELHGRLDEGDSRPYYLYAGLADPLISSPDDQLWDRAMFFSLRWRFLGKRCQEILVIAIFEPLCEYPAIVDRLQQSLGPAALRLLNDLLSFWGRPDELVNWFSKRRYAVCPL